jgi:hypothetical protein
LSSTPKPGVDPAEYEHWVRERDYALMIAAFATFFIAMTSYVLRKTEGEWKIAVMMGHPPANVIRAD